MSHEIVNTVHILEFENFNDSCSLNPVEIAINSNKIIKTLTSYKKYKFRFVIDSPLFITNLQNTSHIIFITCNGLVEAEAALINSKFYKTLGVVYLSEIKNWI